MSPKPLSGENRNISPGTMLGPYEIRSLLGAGGMGEVYRARDNRIGREVAVKILPAGLLRDHARRARFTHEAKASGSLNHPNIVAVYDLDLEADPPYIVTELVEGFPLRKLVQDGRVGIKQLLDIAVQLADGLSAAHRQRFVHRDLKPENIILTPEGRPKILDFGLAKRLPSTTSGDAETVLAGLTMDGMVVGTVQYMSPEQARGRFVDTRSDIFSLGVILFEMASGQHPFVRESAAETMTAIIKDDPPEIGASIPVSLRWTIQRCLAKDPEARYHSTSDLYLELRQQWQYVNQLTTQAALAPVATGSLPIPVRKALPWPIVGVAAAAILCGLIAGRFTAPAPPVPLSSKQFRPLASSGVNEDSAAWSPDGKAIAYQSPVNGISQIFVKSLDSPTPTAVTHCREDCVNPVWSADGQRLFLMTGNGISSVGAAGGDPQRVVDDAFQYAISPKGDALAIVRRSHNPLTFSVWISSPIGAPPVRYEPEPYRNVRAIVNTCALTFSPDGKQLLFSAQFGGESRTAQFWLLPLPSGSGKPRRVLESRQATINVRGMSWMPNGRVLLAYTEAPDSIRSHIYVADLEKDTAIPLFTSIASESWPQVSRDGSKLAYTALEQDTQILELPLDGSPVRDLIASSRMERSPHWSPRGRELTFVSDRNGVDEIWVRTADPGWEKPLVSSTEPADRLDTPVFSPDGARVAFVRAGEIWLASVAGGEPVRLLAPASELQLAPTWSPDGRWIAYYSGGKPGGLKKIRIGSTEPPVVLRETVGNCPNCVPEWSPNGDWISYSTMQETVLVSSTDGKSRTLRKPPLQATTWSRDSATVYGLSDDDGTQRLVAIDFATGKERVISTIPDSIRLQGIRTLSLKLSLSPDGKTLATSSYRLTGDIWMIDGIEEKRGLWNWFRQR